MDGLAQANGSQASRMRKQLLEESRELINRKAAEALAHRHLFAQPGRCSWLGDEDRIRVDLGVRLQRVAHLARRHIIPPKHSIGQQKEEVVVGVHLGHLLDSLKSGAEAVIAGSAAR